MWNGLSAPHPDPLGAPVALPMQRAKGEEGQGEGRRQAPHLTFSPAGEKAGMRGECADTCADS